MIQEPPWVSGDCHPVRAGQVDPGTALSSLVGRDAWENAGRHSQHSIYASDTSFLLNANSEALWFVRSKDRIPEYISAHPKGAALWQAVIDVLPGQTKVEPSLVHIDYWSGNILWDQDRISAVVDWEEASQGDPGIDVAYCRMEMVLVGMIEAAATFLEIYERETGKPVSNLGLWELAAAVRPMFNPEGWISESPAKARFADFVDAAIERTCR